MDDTDENEHIISTLGEMIASMRSHFSIPHTIRLYILAACLSVITLAVTNRFNTELVWVSITATILAFHEYLSYQVKLTTGALTKVFPGYLSWIDARLPQEILIVAANLLLAFPMLAYEESHRYTISVISFLLFPAALWVVGTYIHAVVIETGLNESVIRDEFGDSVLQRDPHRLATIFGLLLFFLSWRQVYYVLYNPPSNLFHPILISTLFLIVLVISLCPPSIFHWELAAGFLFINAIPEYIWVYEKIFKHIKRVSYMLISLFLFIVAYFFYNSSLGILNDEPPFTMRITVVASWFLIAILILLHQISHMINETLDEDEEDDTAVADKRK